MPESHEREIGPPREGPRDVVDRSHQALELGVEARGAGGALLLDEQ